MERQLTLLEQEPEWKLDEHTREVGRAGLAEARQALRQALRDAGAAALPGRARSAA